MIKHTSMNSFVRREVVYSPVKTLTSLRCKSYMTTAVKYLFINNISENDIDEKFESFSWMIP